MPEFEIRNQEVEEGLPPAIELTKPEELGCPSLK